MVRKIIVVGWALLCLAVWARAGVFYAASCSACGYKCDDLHVGSGMYPCGRNGLYCARDWKTVVIVHFDLRKLLPPGTDPGPNADENALGAACDKYLGDWRYPAVIEAGKLPSYAALGVAYQGKPVPRLELVETGVPINGKPYTCPRCGKVKLMFMRAGLWD